MTVKVLVQLLGCQCGDTALTCSTSLPPTYSYTYLLVHWLHLLLLCPQDKASFPMRGSVAHTLTHGVGVSFLGLQLRRGR